MNEFTLSSFETTYICKSKAKQVNCSKTSLPSSKTLCCDAFALRTERLFAQALRLPWRLEGHLLICNNNIINVYKSVEMTYWSYCMCSAFPFRLFFFFIFILISLLFIFILPQEDYTCEGASPLLAGASSARASRALFHCSLSKSPQKKSKYVKKSLKAHLTGLRKRVDHGHAKGGFYALLRVNFLHSYIDLLRVN